jgi:hypothetical protein
MFSIVLPLFLPSSVVHGTNLFSYSPQPTTSEVSRIALVPRGHLQLISYCSLLPKCNFDIDVAVDVVRGDRCRTSLREDLF